jgi:hypothetical protein
MSVDHSNVSLSWLTRLRWGMVAGQLAATLIAYEFLDIDLRLGRIFLSISLTAATNVLLLWQLRLNRAVSHGLCGAVLTFDTLILTALLHATGGSANPFRSGVSPARSHCELRASPGAGALAHHVPDRANQALAGRYLCGLSADRFAGCVG